MTSEAIDTTPELLDSIDPAALATRLVQLAETNPRDLLLIAARAALEIADARRADRRAQIEATDDVRADPSWTGYTDRHIAHAELVRRRTVPGPLATDQEAVA